MKWKIRDLIGESCITLDDGQKVFDLIVPEMKAGRPVELDFSGVEAFAAPFFNAAFGRLLKDFKPVDLNRLLKVSNIATVGADVLKLVIRNSVQYSG